MPWKRKDSLGNSKVYISNEKNDIYNEIRRFLKTHSVSELIQIIGNVLEEKENAD